MKRFCGFFVSPLANLPEIWYTEQNKHKGDKMFRKYLLVFLISMVPLIELRGGVPFAVGMGLPYFESLAVCVFGNMLPVPFIYFFARKVLLWGSKQKHIGKFCAFFVEKGEHAGQKLVTVAPLGGDESVIYASTLAGKDSMRIIVTGHEEQTIVTALFDNLGKGASGAAIQNMNILLGVDETTGLDV